jgi:Tol biopolymer transport system component
MRPQVVYAAAAIFISAGIPISGGGQAAPRPAPAPASPAAAATQTPPNTEIYLARLLHHGDSLVLTPPQNVTRRVGYDNQPSFLIDASGFLYTAIGADGQADVWRYDIRTRRRTRLTNTPESEYSPTVMPGGTRFSVVRVERDSTQRLWSFALDGTDPQLVLRALKPVGYHAWLDAFRLATYVLGTPSTLHVIRRDGSGDEERAHDIGRALQRIPGQQWYSFTQRDSAKALWIMAQPFDGGDASQLVRTPPDDEFFVWTPDGTLLSASGGSLVRWNGVSGDGGEWVPVASFAAAKVKNVSRLAVSPDGKWLAFVAEPAGP